MGHSTPTFPIKIKRSFLFLFPLLQCKITTPFGQQSEGIDDLCFHTENFPLVFLLYLGPPFCQIFPNMANFAKFPEKEDEKIPDQWESISHEPLWATALHLHSILITNYFSRTRVPLTICYIYGYFLLYVIVLCDCAHFGHMSEWCFQI